MLTSTDRRMWKKRGWESNNSKRLTQLELVMEQLELEARTTCGACAWNLQIGGHGERNYVFGLYLTKQSSRGLLVVSFLLLIYETGTVFL